jgi:predicted Zn-dependent protease
MVDLMRALAVLMFWLAAAASQAAQLAYEPIGLAWSAEEVEHTAAARRAALVERAQQAQQLGCRQQCERLAAIFERLLSQARLQTARSASLPWTLSVVQLPDIEAEAVSGGLVAVSEPYLDRRALSDEALAFVLAHEMAHIILEHERQALTFALLLLPRQVTRSVQDMYVEMDFSLSLLKRMEPVLHQGEFEADELGLLMASAAGFDPDRQLAYMQQECAFDSARSGLVSTHPAACERLRALHARLPLARRQLPDKSSLR